MSQRVTFAGAEAGIGIVVLGLFALLGVLGFVGVAVLVATGQIPREAGNLALVAGFGLGLAWWCRGIVRDMRRVRVIERTDDGTWILKGPFGIHRGTIAASTPREITEHQERTWILVGTARTYRRTYAEIKADGRRWVTCMNPIEAQRGALATLRSWT